MIKKIMLAAMAMVLSVGAMAQTVIETVVTVGTMTVPAVQISMDKDVKLVQEAMKTRLKDAGLKTKNTEGYLAAVEQVFAELSPSPVSFYSKIEEQGRKKDKATVVTVCAIPTDLTQNPATMTAALRAFLEGFPRYVDRYEAMLNLQREEENLRKAEKAAALAAADVASIEKNVSSMQGKIQDKQKEIEKLRAKIADCENDIADLQKKIEKEGDRRSDAAKKAAAAEENVRAVQAEVDRYRQMAN